MLLLFVLDGFTLAWSNAGLAAPAFAVGLLGGTNYIQTMLAIDKRLPPSMRELALATVSAGAPVGMLLADMTGLLLQWCLFRAHGLSVRGGWCPLVANGTFA